MSFWDWVPSIITAGATIWGANQASKATQSAANTAATSQQGATAAELQAIEEARQNSLGMQKMASPGLTALQGVIGRGSTLTPEQIQALDDARRTTLDSLNGGSLRGSARATAATVADVEGRMRNGFMTSNQQAADQAASNLSGQYFNAGNNVDNLLLNKGQTASAGLINTGDINAANTLGQSNITGKAIGDIGAVIADQIKTQNNQKRDSSYQTILPSGETINWNTPRKGAL